MSAIKKFFEKKKTEAKFKLAGPGQKLGDARSHNAEMQARLNMAQAASQPREASVKRGTMSDQQKAAAAAAMSRLGGQGSSSSGDYEKRRSQAAIRAMAQRELEKEKLRDQEIEKLKSTYGEKPTIELEGPSVLSCEGVFYKCPLIGDGKVLPKNEMKKMIRDFLYEQLNTEDRGLTACLIIHTLNKDAERVKVCVNTLSKYLDNIIQNPSDEKFRKIRKSNKAFEERIIPIEGTDVFLSAAGFGPATLDGQDFWKFPDELLEGEAQASTLEQLNALKEALNSAEPIQAELDRGMKVLLPGQASENVTLPPDFFSLSAEEIKKEQQARTDAVERQGMLRTKAMREREEQREKRKYRFTLIRIRFPDGLILQGTFNVYEKYSNLLEFVQEALEFPLPFVLRGTQGPFLDTEDKMLLDVGLVPSAILTFAWRPDVAAEVEEQLKNVIIDGEKPLYIKHEVVDVALRKE